MGDQTTLVDHSETARNGDNSESFHRYCRDMGKFALLTPREEVELGHKIKKGDSGAWEVMVKANLRLVVNIAKDFEGRGVPLLDLIQEGNLGLFKAVDRFDPENGAKFSTYGVWWIRKFIKLAFPNQLGSIRIPTGAYEKIGQMRTFVTEFQKDFGQLPDDEDIAEELKISVGRVQQLKRAGYPSTPLDAPIEEGKEKTLAEVIPDQFAKNPAGQYQIKADCERLLSFIPRLPERDQKILRLRFGLDNGGDCLVQEKVAQIIGRTRQRVDQIERKALLKLRAMMEGQEYTPKRKKRTKKTK